MDTERTQTSQSLETTRRYEFFGAYNHSLDSKGRLIIPQGFRERLGADIVVGVNMAQSSIAVYPLEIWRRKVDMLTELVEEDVSAEVFLERFSMLSFDNVSFDPQGRVLIPAALRELYLGGASGVQVSGAREYIRIISTAQAETEAERFRTDHPDILRDISLIQARIRAKSQI